MLLSKFVLAILAEEPVKDGKQQEKHDSIQYNQLDLCMWPGNQEIHTYEVASMGKKIHSLLINYWRDYNLNALVLRVPSNGSLPLTSPCLQRLKNDFDKVWVWNTTLPPLSHGGWASIWRHGRIGMVEVPLMKQIGGVKGEPLLAVREGEVEPLLTDASSAVLT